jgi:hypothetical protein
MRVLLREPLTHFLLLGAALFAMDRVVGSRGVEAPGTIVVSAGEIESLAAGFTKASQRRPNDDELQRLIDDRVREDVYCREAIALGLDKDDPVIRRRLTDKLQFVSEDVAPEVEPAESDLRAYFAAHEAAFRVESRLTFRHVYLDPARHRDALAGDAQRLLDRLNASGTRVDPAAVGDMFLPSHTFDDVPSGVVSRQFGDAFAATLVDLPIGRWQGPIMSGYGAHLVQVTARVDGRRPSFEEVREAVGRAWKDARRQEANTAFYKRLLAKYRVTIERPAAGRIAP